MVFAIPKIEQLRGIARSALQSAFGTPIRPESTLSKLADLRAGQVFLMHGRLAGIAKQTIPDTADGLYLERWAAIFGVRRIPPAMAKGLCTFTGSDDSPIPKGLSLVRTDGERFEVEQDGLISQGTASVAVRSINAGQIGDTQAGEVLSFGQTIAGLDSAAIVGADGLSGGADVETDKSLRDRMLLQIKKRPQGGSAEDYERWAREIAEVTRAWTIPLINGAGTVGIAVVADANDPITPSQVKLDEIQAAIDELRPVTASVTVFTPELVPLNPQIKLSPNTPEVQANVAASIEDVLLRRSVPAGTIPVSHIKEAISVAPGEFDHELLAPTENVTVTQGQLLVLGAPVFTAL